MHLGHQIRIYSAKCAKPCVYGDCFAQSDNFMTHSHMLTFEEKLNGFMLLELSKLFKLCLSRTKLEQTNISKSEPR